MWAPLPGWPAGEFARAIGAFKSHLVAANIATPTGLFPFELRWSHPAPPGAVPADWSFTDPASDAGQMEFSDAEGGPIYDLKPVGDALGVLRAGSIWLMRYVGPPLIFSFSVLASQVGVWGPGSAAVVRGGRVVVFTGDDLVLVSESGVQSLLEGVARRWLQSSFSGGSVPLVQHPREPEVWACLRLGGEPVALVYNLHLGALSIASLPDSGDTAGTWKRAVLSPTWAATNYPWATATSSWGMLDEVREAAVLGTDDGFLALDEGEPAEALLVRRQLPPGLDPTRRTLVRLVEAVSDARPAITVRARGSVDSDPSVTVLADRAWIGVSGESYDLELRYLAGQPFRLTQVVVDDLAVGLSI